MGARTDDTRRRSPVVAKQGQDQLRYRPDLGLSPRTVDKHLEQIYAKLGVENRTAAAAIATSTGRKNS